MEPFLNISRTSAFDNFNRIIPGTIQSILEGKRPVIRSDGTPLRDYLYVDDAVSAYLALGDSEEIGGTGGRGAGDNAVEGFPRTSMPNPARPLKQFRKGPRANRVRSAARKRRETALLRRWWFFLENHSQNIAMLRLNGRP